MEKYDIKGIVLQVYFIIKFRSISLDSLKDEKCSSQPALPH